MSNKISPSNNDKMHILPYGLCMYIIGLSRQYIESATSGIIGSVVSILAMVLCTLYFSKKIEI